VGLFSALVGVQLKGQASCFAQMKTAKDPWIMSKLLDQIIAEGFNNSSSIVAILEEAVQFGFVITLLELTEVLTELQEAYGPIQNISKDDFSTLLAKETKTAYTALAPMAHMMAERYREDKPLTQIRSIGCFRGVGMVAAELCVMANEGPLDEDQLKIISEEYNSFLRAASNNYEEVKSLSKINIARGFNALEALARYQQGKKD